MGVTSDANTSHEELNIATSTPEAAAPTFELPVAGPSKPAKKTRTKAKSTKDDQPTAEDLMNLGIKVKDFAYVHTALPPVRTIYRHPQQVQPSVTRNPGILKRQLTEIADEDGIFSQQSQQSSQPVERADTEPILESPSIAREHALLDLKGIVPANQRTTTSQPIHSPSNKKCNTIPASQTSNGVATPLVMPNGSLQWQLATSNVMPLSTLDLANKVIVPGQPSAFQRTLSQFSASSSRMNITSAFSSPLSSVPSSPMPLLSPLRSKKVTSSTLLRRQPSRLAKPRCFFKLSPEKPSNKKHYNLRKRPADAIVAINPSPSKRIRFTVTEPTAHHRGTSSQSQNAALGNRKSKRR